MIYGAPQIGASTKPEAAAAKRNRRVLAGIAAKKETMSNMNQSDRNASKNKPLTAPHSKEAEASLLGLILMNNDAFMRVADSLKANHFFEPAHRLIFEICSDMIRSGQIATPTTIKSFLPADLNVAGIGLDQYLDRLAAEATTILNAAEYGRTIYELSLRRDLITIADEMRHNVIHSDLDVEPIQQIEEIERKLSRLKAGLNGSASSTALRVTCVNDVEPEDVQWVHRNRLARGHVTLMVGAPGDGKSQISCDTTGRITTGSDWPDGGKAPLGSVVMFVRRGYS